MGLNEPRIFAIAAVVSILAGIGIGAGFAMTFESLFCQAVGPYRVCNFNLLQGLAIMTLLFGIGGIGGVLPHVIQREKKIAL